VSDSRKPRSPGDAVTEKVAQRADRKLRSRRRAHRPVWYALGMYGLVGWSIAMPAVAGAALGLWLDRKFPSSFSWTLTLLSAGLILGCVNAWVKRESQEDDFERGDLEGDDFRKDDVGNGH
jgi:ATP synthase protein I